MKMSSEFQYKMKDSWNPCDVTFSTPAAARSRCLGKKLDEMEKDFFGISWISQQKYISPESKRSAPGRLAACGGPTPKSGRKIRKRFVG